MRAAQKSKLIRPPESAGSEEAASRKPSAQAATAIADSPDWTTRAKPKGIAQVPTHAVHPPEERRGWSRARLKLPLRLTRVAGQRELMMHPLRTLNISSSGVCFLCPQLIKPGTPLDIEVCLIDGPFVRGSVIMRAEAHVVRAEQVPEDGWHSLAATFDDITFQREEPMPPRFQHR